jgi:two-component system sensor histidine kinase KdpD
MADRPDAEALLAKLKEEESRAGRGRLKIFLGMAAGVGKTYKMLESARELLSEGIDVVAGCVVTHGRKETEALLTGLEILPPRIVEYKGAKLEELNLDAALERMPQVILVDELAHTNAPDCRHEKRWQDVEELLEAGISVYTTLNVQHLESANDIVAQITRVQVRETVPDSIFEKAYEIELVDLPADELIQRLKDGKVYLADKSAVALANFFRKGNLIALRELALRCTAERVDKQMQKYRTDESIKTVWPATERILVCVGPSPLSARVVRSARRIASRLKAEWLAVYGDPCLCPHAQARPHETDSNAAAGRIVGSSDNCLDWDQRYRGTHCFRAQAQCIAHFDWQAGQTSLDRTDLWISSRSTDPQQRRIRNNRSFRRRNASGY